MVPVGARGARAVLVQAQAVGGHGRGVVVAQGGGASGGTVHVLHVDAAVTAGQVVFTHPGTRSSTHIGKHARTNTHEYTHTNTNT